VEIEYFSCVACGHIRQREHLHNGFCSPGCDMQTVRFLDGPIAGQTRAVTGKPHEFLVDIPPTDPWRFDKFDVSAGMITDIRLDRLVYTIKRSHFRGDTTHVGAIGKHVGDLVKVKVPFAAEIADSPTIRKAIEQQAHDQLIWTCSAEKLIPDQPRKVYFGPPDRYLDVDVSNRVPIGFHIAVYQAVAVDPNGWNSTRHPQWTRERKEL
jgi:hypothetical protein